MGRGYRQPSLIGRILREAAALAAGRARPRQSLNALRHRMASRRSERVRHQPLFLNLMVSPACNLSCRMCLTHSPIVPDNPHKFRGRTCLTLETFADILARFPSTRILGFIGNGEPLLAPDLFRMVALGKRSGKMVTILYTNGTLVGQHTEELLSGDLDLINISVNAAEEEDYARLTGMPEAFYRAIVDNTRALSRSCGRGRTPTRLTASLLVDRVNWRRIPEMIGFAAGLGMDGVNLVNLVPTAAPGWDAETVCLFDTPEILSFIQGLKARRWPIGVEWPVLLDGTRDNRLCRDPWFGMTVDGEGNVNACGRQCLNSEGNGNFRDPDVFNNPHFRMWRRTFLDRRIPLPAPCRTCYNNSTHARGLK